MIPQQPAETLRPVTADVALLLDTHESMLPCLEALHRTVAAFLASLTDPHAYDHAVVKDWRVRTMGFSCRDVAQGHWSSDSLFSGDLPLAIRRFSALSADDGSTAPRPLLEALYAASRWPTTEQGETPRADAWRHVRDVRRAVIVFSNGPCELSYRTGAKVSGTLDELALSLISMRLRLFLFVPDAPCYEALDDIDLSWSLRCGPPDTATDGLARFAAAPTQFQSVMRHQLMALRAMRVG